MTFGRYTIHPINENTFAIEEKTRFTQGLCYLLCGEAKALLIDTGFGFKGFDGIVKSLTDLPVTVANTHAHLDHIGGNHFFDEIWYHEADKKIFALHTDPRYTLGVAAEGMSRAAYALMSLFAKDLLNIDTSGNYRHFGDTHVFRLGERDVEVIPTPGHTPGSVCFLDRRAGMLFSGDTVCEWGILLHIAGEACPPAVFLDSMLRLKRLWDAFDSVWPGHHGFPTEKSYIDDYLACAKQITEGSASYGLTKGRPCAEFGRVLITVPDEVAADG
ncbi:MAG: MBL fold metallo-hydrolase [Clostridiales Family XIII bacterium]|jgi:glyoxylase-like metal-dependent hydrolase (beta-lactamase superfamily II)|nr:MBL fold metallo-hydrolase [Clostridiales Family XIII bacterium]